MAKRPSSAGRKSSTTRSTTRKGGAKIEPAATSVQQLDAREREGMTPQASTSAAMAHEVTTITHDMIAERAYQIWLEQGGDANDNWLS